MIRAGRERDTRREWADRASRGLDDQVSQTGAALLGAGMRVIMRPHYQTARQAPRLFKSHICKSSSV